MTKIISKNGLILAAFALIVTAIVTLTQQLTKDAITKQEQRYLLTLLEQVVEPSSYNNDLANQCVLVTAPNLLGRTTAQRAFIAKNDGNPVAIAIETTAPNGYNGNIDLLVGVTLQGEVSGVRTLRHTETPGLGDKIEIAKSSWMDSFKGWFLSDNNQSHWRVKKDGGKFDQFTGATITPRAVVEATRKAVEYVNSHQTSILQSTQACGGQS